MLAGYGLAALTKPLFPLAESAGVIVAARFADRFGKGLRGAPRDAIVADVTTPSQRDAAYGLRQSLDTVGAFLGPLLAMGLLVLWAGQLRAVLWAATVPALIAVALLAFGLREPARVATPGAEAPRLAWRSLRDFPRAFWTLIGLAALFALARLSEAFLVLRAQALAVPLPFIPLVIIVMSAAYALSSYAATMFGGAGARTLRLALGLVLLVAGYAALSWGPGTPALWLGVTLYGLHMGLTQGTLSAAVADAAPEELRATAFGVFHFVSGVFQLAGAALGGWLWTAHGSVATFALGMAGAMAALGVCGVSGRAPRRSRAG
jgi:MFS family permease